jgi:hypothetical protein
MYLIYNIVYIIKNIYYTHEDESDGIRCVKFCKLVEDPERHYSSYDRNVRRVHMQDNTNTNLIQCV